MIILILLIEKNVFKNLFKFNHYKKILLNKCIEELSYLLYNNIDTSRQNE